MNKIPTIKQLDKFTKSQLELLKLRLEKVLVNKPSRENRKGLYPKSYYEMDAYYR